MDKSTAKEKWYTISDYVDIDTGELISRADFERNYYKIRKTKKTEENGNIKIIRHTTECRHNGQLELF